MKECSGGVCAAKGFYANGIHCGIRKNKTKKDFSLIYSKTLCSAASTYTQNKVKGAPILVTKKHLENGLAQAIVINSGNANTCNANGIEIAQAMCDLCAQGLSIKSEDVIVASTGVIGEELSIDPMKQHIQELVDGLHESGSHDACSGIMTTDTFEKEYALSFTLHGKQAHIGGIAKGSGMIHPNMATMLSFITSDVSIEPALLKEAVSDVVNDTFNMISVDGDTSTNDMLSVLCNGQSGNPTITQKDESYEIFKQVLFEVCKNLSKMMASDGEGASKLLTCKVNNAKTTKDAKTIAKSIITSSLFKAAMFGCDANWGRILCAIGYADAQCDVDKIDVSLISKKGKIQVCLNGRGCGLDEDKALLILKEKEVIIEVDLKDGEANSTAWGCDLTYDYVKINGEYRS